MIEAYSSKHVPQSHCFQRPRNHFLFKSHNQETTFNLRWSNANCWEICFSASVNILFVILLKKLLSINKCLRQTNLDAHSHTPTSPPNKIASGAGEGVKPAIAYDIADTDVYNGDDVKDVT